MAEGTVTTRPRARSFIIKRPRLTKLLDESEARILLLVAPAGYGKTTLAREWLDGKDGVAWYSGGPSMADVAALAAEVAEALAPTDDDLVERVRNLAAQSQSPEVLARAVAASDAAKRCAVLAIDDCHHAIGSHPANAFLNELISRTEFRVVGTSRVRPAWVTPRMLVYGEAAMLEMDELAFTDAEAGAVLGKSDASKIFLTESGGWPAVVGLAAVRSANGTPDNSGPHENFYEFFADELFRHASPALRRGLLFLSLGANANRELTRKLLGADADALLVEGSEWGLLTVGPDSTSMHPLLRNFLVTKVRELHDDERRDLVKQVVEGLAACSLWDSCLTTLEEFPLTDVLASTLAPALIGLLDAGRSRTAARWLKLARANSVAHPLMLLAGAEIALREGDVRRSQALGERAGHLLDADLAARAFVVAARAAHLGDDNVSAIRNAQHAEAVATTRPTRTAALWTQLVSGMEEPDDDLPATLQRLEDIGDDSPEFALRIAFARGSMLFNIDLDAKSAMREFRAAAALLADVHDPFLKTSFLNFFAHVSETAGRYEHALDMAKQQIEEAQSAGLEFPIDHALVTRAASLIGLRKFRLAQQVIDELHRRALAAQPNVLQNTHLLSVRMCLASGDLTRAAALLEREDEDGVDPGTKAETHAYRALVLATLGRVQDAIEALRQASDKGRFGAYAIRQLAAAIVGLNNPGADGVLLAIATLRQMTRVGGVDAIATACRAYPNLARAGLEDPEVGRALLDVFARSRDVDLARRVGLEVPRELRRSEGLTGREEEVYALLVQGRTNGEIAKTLFISQSTAKVHVRHIFEKLGVHTRAEAAAARSATPM